MSKINWALIGSIVVISAIILTLYSTASFSRNLGQWENTDPEIRQWYENLKQPDNPQISCCGESDAYWADSYEMKNGKFYAIITDDRPDAPLKREHIPVGTHIEIPDGKIINSIKQQNPTGHGIVFVSRNLWPYCYVLPGGV